MFKARSSSLRLRHEAYIQVCRGLMIAAVCLGFFGAIFALIGMKCTKIGGSETTKARLTVLSGFHFILSGVCLDLLNYPLISFCFEFKVSILVFVFAGLCCMTACSIYAHRITTDFFDPMFVAQK